MPSTIAGPVLRVSELSLNLGSIVCFGKSSRALSALRIGGIYGLINPWWTSLYPIALDHNFLVKGFGDGDSGSLGQIQKVSCVAAQMIGRLFGIVAVIEFVLSRIVGQANDGHIKVMLDKVRVNVGEGGGDKGP